MTVNHTNIKIKFIKVKQENILGRREKNLLQTFKINRNYSQLMTVVTRDGR